MKYLCAIFCILNLIIGTAGSLPIFMVTTLSQGTQGGNELNFFVLALKELNFFVLALIAFPFTCFACAILCPVMFHYNFNRLSVLFGLLPTILVLMLVLFIINFISTMQ